MAELEFKRPSPTIEPSFRALMVYVNTKTGATMGSVPVVWPVIGAESGGASFISDKTLGLLREFAQSLERDMGRRVFEFGQTEPDANNKPDHEGTPLTGLGGRR